MTLCCCLSFDLTSKKPKENTAVDDGCSKMLPQPPHVREGDVASLHHPTRGATVRLWDI